MALIGKMVKKGLVTRKGNFQFRPSQRVCLFAFCRLGLWNTARKGVVFETIRLGALSNQVETLDRCDRSQ